MFQLNCHHQAAYTPIAKTYSDKILLQCSNISNVQIIRSSNSQYLKSYKMTIWCVVDHKLLYSNSSFHWLHSSPCSLCVYASCCSWSF